MGLDWKCIEGQTPIDEDEREGLLTQTVTTQSELNEFEQKNIEEAMLWVMGRKFKAQEVCSEHFVRRVHKKMFGEVWSWAGEFRRTDKNIGVVKHQISVALKMLCDDALYWIENKTYPAEEIAVRFKHKLVSIHCFPNGNGRHSRLMGDILNEKIFGLRPWTWGAQDLAKSGNARSTYLQAIKAADRGDFAPLLAFVRS